MLFFLVSWTTTYIYVLMPGERPSYHVLIMYCSSSMSFVIIFVMKDDGFHEDLVVVYLISGDFKDCNQLLIMERG